MPAAGPEILTHIDGPRDIFGFPALTVPFGYVSGNPLSDSATYDNTTLAMLGVAPGAYEWTWGTGADQSFTLQIGPVAATPLPAALPLFATGLGSLGLFRWLRKRKSPAAVAA